MIYLFVSVYDYHWWGGIHLKAICLLFRRHTVIYILRARVCSSEIWLVVKHNVIMISRPIRANSRPWKLKLIIIFDPNYCCGRRVRLFVSLSIVSSPPLAIIVRAVLIPANRLRISSRSLRIVVIQPLWLCNRFCIVLLLNQLCSFSGRSYNWLCSDI